MTIGLALNRDHLGFRADTEWGPRFAEGGAFEPSPPGFDLQGMSTWRLLRHGPRADSIAIRGDMRVYFKPLPLDPASAVIDCGEGGNLDLYTLFGFESPEGSAAWTIRPNAGLVFDAPAVSSDLTVTIYAEPRSTAGVYSSQPMTLSVNGRQVFTGALATRGSVVARVPAEVWNARLPVMMVLHLPAAVSAHDLGLSMDRRMFGWNIERIVFAPAR